MNKLNFSKETAEAFAAFIKGTLSQPPVRILETCCGKGNVTEFLLKEYPAAQYTAADPDPEVLEKFNKRFGTAITRSFVRQPDRPLEVTNFDLAVTLSGLCLAADRVRALRNLYAAVKLGGTLCAAIPADENAEDFKLHFASHFGDVLFEKHQDLFFVKGNLER